LFECLALHLEREPLPDMLAGKENGTYKTWSTPEVNETIHQLSMGLLRSGISGENRTVEGMDKVGIISKNRPEWIIVDAAVQQTGAVLTPIYPTIAVGELEFILNDAQVKIIFVNDEDLFHKVLSIKGRIPSLREIYTFMWWARGTGRSCW
jgi:long-chain acyl-CoA synthetase